jgi:maltooligosyltrehalose trehalohydrolase
MLWMGEEYSETHPFQYFVSHTDPELAEAVRKGRKAEFAAFHAMGEAPDPMAEETFNGSKLQWELVNQEPHQTMFRWYQTLIRLRKELPALRYLDRQNLEVEVNEERKTLILHRRQEDHHVLCLMNFSKGTQTVTVPAYVKQWPKLLDSASPEWRGQSAAPDTAMAGETLTLCPESFLLFATA